MSIQKDMKAERQKSPGAFIEALLPLALIALSETPGEAASKLEEFSNSPGMGKDKRVLLLSLATRLKAETAFPPNVEAEQRAFFARITSDATVKASEMLSTESEATVQTEIQTRSETIVVYKPRPQVPHICEECGRNFNAYELAKYCGASCRHTAYRRRKRLAQVAKEETAA